MYRRYMYIFEEIGNRIKIRFASGIAALEDIIPSFPGWTDIFGDKYHTNFFLNIRENTIKLLNNLDRGSAINYLTDFNIFLEILLIPCVVLLREDIISTRSSEDTGYEKKELVWLLSE